MFHRKKSFENLRKLDVFLYLKCEKSVKKKRYYEDKWDKMKTSIFEENMGDKNGILRDFIVQKEKKSRKWEDSKEVQITVFCGIEMSKVLSFFYSNYEKNVIFIKGYPFEMSFWSQRKIHNLE